MTAPGARDAAAGPARHPALGDADPGGLRGNAATILLVVLGALLVATPFIEMVPGGELIETALSAAVFLFAIVALGARRAAFSIALLLAVPTLLVRLIGHLHPSPALNVAYSTLAFLFLAFVAGSLLLAVVRAPRVTRETVCAGLSAYLLVGASWAFLYRLLAQADPHAFTLPASEQAMGEFESMYFSFVTIVGLGYGDITPISPIGRMLAVSEALTGLLFVATLISRLVGAYGAREER